VQGLAEDGDHMLNRTDVLNWALDAGIHVSEKNSFADDMYISVLYRFASIATAAERKAAEERVADLFADMETPYLPDIINAIRNERYTNLADLCADAIRARGNNE
jgi:hypothetical protein